jgi:hypothetical protein
MKISTFFSSKCGEFRGFFYQKSFVKVTTFFFCCQTTKKFPQISHATTHLSFKLLPITGPALFVNTASPLP